MTKFRHSKRRSEDKSRSASRLAVVQALYQMELANQDSESALNEFIDHRLGQEIEGEQYMEADKKYFASLVRGVVEQQHDIDRAIARSVPKEWPFDRIDPIMRAILRSAAYELMQQPDVPTRIVVNEYMHIATAFFEDGEENVFIGGVLNRLARDQRPAADVEPAAGQ
jgi:transcription antitermination protein NusB